MLDPSCRQTIDDADAVQVCQSLIKGPALGQVGLRAIARWRFFNHQGQPIGCGSWLTGVFQQQRKRGTVRGRQGVGFTGGQDIDNDVVVP